MRKEIKEFIKNKVTGDCVVFESPVVYLRKEKFYWAKVKGPVIRIYLRVEEEGMDWPVEEFKL